MAKPDDNPEHRVDRARTGERATTTRILDTYEAGLVLTGSEVKSLRDGQGEPLRRLRHRARTARSSCSTCTSRRTSARSYNNHEPTRTRKLLLHKREIRRLIGAVERQGLTLIPLELYFKSGVAKVAMALGKGKKLHDKRDAEKQRDADREIARAVRTR